MSHSAPNECIHSDAQSIPQDTAVKARAPASVQPTAAPTVPPQCNVVRAGKCSRLRTTTNEERAFSQVSSTLPRGGNGGQTQNEARNLSGRGSSGRGLWSSGFLGARPLASRPVASRPLAFRPLASRPLSLSVAISARLTYCVFHQISQIAIPARPARLS